MYNVFGSDIMASIGIDILKIDRIEKIKSKEKFMNNIFNIKEIEYINKKNNRNDTIAGLYCAKEAFLKAIKKGIDYYSLKDIEVSHNEDGAPFIILHNELEKKYKNIDISLSISHDGEYATAIVLI